MGSDASGGAGTRLLRWGRGQRLARGGVAVLVVVVLVLVAGTWAVASRAGASRSSLTTASGDRVGQIRVVPSPANALRASVEVTGAPAGELVVEVSDPDGGGWRVEPGAVDGAATVPLVQLRPSTGYGVVVSVLDDAGEELARGGPVRLRTRTLPADLPPFEVDSDPSRMTPGVTLFDATATPPDEDAPPRREGYLVAVDEAGEIVWYHREDQSIQDALYTSQGRLAFIYEETGIREVDPLGGSTREWAGTTVRQERPRDDYGRPILTDEAIPVDTDQMHHEVDETPDGDLVTLSRELEVMDGFDEPLCGDDEEGFDGSYEMVTDTIVTFDPGTGEVVDEWSIADMLDPHDYTDVFVADELCGAYLDPRYPDAEQPIDWTHGNAIELDEPRNVLWVSLRHVDQVIGVRATDDAAGPAGEMVYRLGVGGDFELSSGEWFYHQHAPEVQDDGSLLIYDNGNWRPGTTLEEGADAYPYSRAVRYELDTEAMTATQVWEHRPDRAPAVDAGLGTAGDQGGTVVYAPYIGDADRLPGPRGGEPTVLIGHGGQLDPPAQSPAGPSLAFGELIEVDEATGEVVFHLRNRDPRDETGWRMYRTDRLATLYPPDWTVTPLG